MPTFTVKDRNEGEAAGGPLIYVYADGAWKTLEAEPGWRFDLAIGDHTDSVVMPTGDGDIVVEPPQAPVPREEERIVEDRPSLFSTACKYGFSRGLLYGQPQTQDEAYVVVLEEHGKPRSATQAEVTPYHYMVVVSITDVIEAKVFVDGVPDLIRLLAEVLPLVPPRPPTVQSIYELHKWSVTGSW